MKLTISRNDLLRALTRASGVVQARNTIPVLSNLLLVASATSLTVTGTDMELAAVVLADNAEVAKPGSCTAPADLLRGVVSKLPATAEITLSHDGDQILTVTAGRFRSTITTIAADDFPSMTAGKMSHAFRVSGAILQSLFGRVRFAISNEETRYYLNGVYLHVRPDGMMAAVSTDGHRLARQVHPAPDGAADMPAIIVPSRTVAEVLRLLGGAETVKVEVSASKITFGLDGVTLTSKLIDGTFPEYERVIPRNNDKVLRIETEGFKAAIARVAPLDDSKASAIKLGLTAGTATITARGNDGTALDEMDADWTAEPLEVGFQARYMADIAAQIGATMEVRFSDAGAPMTLHDAANEGFTAVLMPMRV